MEFLCNENSSLIELNFTDNEISDFSALVSLDKLEVVYYGNQKEELISLTTEMKQLNLDVIGGIGKNMRRCKTKK